MRQQIANRHRQEMIRIHQTDRRRDDAVAVRIRIVAERHLILVLELDEAGHRIGTRAIHANLAVMVDAS